MFTFNYTVVRRVLFLGMLLFSNLVLADEQQIVIDTNLIAIHNPGTQVAGTHSAKSAVLMIHGWASNMNEVGGMYSQLAERLADRGIASLRINIRGESEREKSNYRMTSTFTSRLIDAQQGLGFLQSQYPNTPIALVGFSLGGATAMALVGQDPTAIDSVVLWSSAGDPAAMVSTMPNAVVQEVLSVGEAKLQEWVELTITRQHLVGMLGHDIFSPLKRYSGALLSIRGADDFVTPQEAIIFSHASAAPEESVIISGADHIYHALSTDKQYVERVLTHTVRWFEDTLP